MSTTGTMIRHVSAPTNLERHESVIFYPTFGALMPDGVTWRIPICGTVFEPGRLGLTKRLLIRLLQRVMKAERIELQSEIFQRRIGGFVVESERGKRVAVRIGDRAQSLHRKTSRLGYFSGYAYVTVGEIAELSRDGDFDSNWLRFRIVSPFDEHQEFIGQAQLLSPRGVSIISDIDDTIKHTEVTCRRSLLRNTFLREFLPINGMAQTYQDWAAQGAAFHYVSSSPWQLYDPLAELTTVFGFPAGSFHLRSFRLRDHMLRRVFLVRRPLKGLMIKQLLKTFPQRTFYLVGDSGERDPEIYGAVARHFPDQVAGVFIRELPDRPMDQRRCQKAFRYVPQQTWSIFSHPEQITARVAVDAIKAARQ